MSKIDQAAKPILTDIYHSRVREFDANDGHALATWATLKLMVVDWSFGDDIVFTTEARDRFYRDPKPVDRLTLDVLRCGEGAWRDGLYVYKTALPMMMLEPLPHDVPTGRRRKAAISFAMGFGDGVLLAHHVIENASVDIDLEFSPATRAWPIVGTGHLPPARISFNAMNATVGCLERMTTVDR